MGLKLFSKYYSEILIEVIKLEFGKGPLSKGDFREFLKCHKSSFRRYGFSYSNFLTQTWAALFEALKNWKEGKSSPSLSKLGSVAVLVLEFLLTLM